MQSNLSNGGLYRGPQKADVNGIMKGGFQDSPGRSLEMSSVGDRGNRITLRSKDLTRRQTSRNLKLPKLTARVTSARGKAEPLGDFAYRVLREIIRRGRIVPGEHLREADVARWLNISRTPVREAFHRLISESLLTNGPWNGAMVAALDVQQIKELYAVRESLEGTAAALAARNASPQEIEQLTNIVAREARERAQPEKRVDINRDLHEAIYAAAHNRYLVQSLRSIVDALGLLYHSTFVLPGSIEQAHQEHIALVAAIRGGQPATAEKLAREHIRHSLEMRLKLHAAERK